MKKIGMLFCAMLASFTLFADPIVWTSPPETISVTGEDSTNPVVVMDPSGNAIALWIGNGFVKSSVMLSGFDWGSISVVSASGASDPFLIVDQAGNATAAWIRSGAVETASLPVGGSWTSPTVLSSSGASSIHMAVDQPGDVVVVWARGGNIESATQLFGGSWPVSPDVIMSTAAAAPRVSIGGVAPNTEVMVVWHGSGMFSNTVIYEADKIMGGSWGAPQPVSDTSLNGQFADIAVDSNGNALAIWYQYTVMGSYFTDITVQTSKKPFGSTWSSAGSFNDAGQRNPADLLARVAFDINGNAMAIWTDSLDDASFMIQSSILPVNGTWMNPIDLASSNLYAYHFNFTINEFSSAFIAYMVYDPTVPGVLIQSSGSYIPEVFEKNWTISNVISQGSQNGFPSIASSLGASSTNNLVAVWVSYDGMNTVIQSATGSNHNALAPTSLNVTQSFNNLNVFQEYYNILTWQDSTSTGVKGYYIIRDGIFLSEVLPGVMQYIDDNREPGVPVTYQLITTTSRAFQSMPATITYP